MTIAKQASAIANKTETRWIKWYLCISFLAPALALGVAFVLQEIHPFGEKQVLVTDLWHQYYPFLRLLQEKLQTGGSLLYTWESGMGTNFLSMIAYYAASPLNLLTILVPQQVLREATAVLILLKVGFAGLFFACFLKGTFRRSDFSLCIFSPMYALCSYILGYYWNIIWLDTVALLPLVVLGLVYLVRDGKYRLYVIALGLSLFTNYYIGLFTCIFAAIAFLCLCVFYLRPRDLLGRGVAMLLGSLTGGALAAVLLLPAYYALQLTYNVQNVFPTTVEFYENWRVLWNDLLSFQAPTAKEGLPNLACGMLPLILIGPFLLSRKIRIREKVAAVLVLAFLFISCNCNVLSYIWHGFHFPNMLPFRFSFLFSFALLTLGYRAFLLLLEEKFRLLDIFAMLAVAIGIYMLASGYLEKRIVYWAFALAFLYVLVFLLRFRNILGTRLFYLAMAILVGFELFENTRLGTQAVSTSDYVSYPSMAASASVLLDKIEAEDDQDLFYRTEMSSNYTLNDPALYGYHGLSQFSSTVNVNVTKWMRALGLTASEAGNRYYYNGSTPVTNLFSAMHYLISRTGGARDTYQWEQIAEESGSFAYRNRYTLPLGFMTQPELETYIANPDGNPFDNQNNLFRLATGIATPLFTKVAVAEEEYIGATAAAHGYGSYSYSIQGDVEQPLLRFSYDVPADAMLYGYAYAYESASLIVNRDGAFVTSYSVSESPYIFAVGEYASNETPGLTFQMKSDAVGGAVTIYVYQLNQEVLEQGYEILASGGVTLTEFSDTKLTGTVEAKQDGLCYFSIPYEAGWRAKVDGEEVEITPISKAMIAIPVLAGEHTIQLSYTPQGLVLGGVLTIGSILLLLALYVLERRRGKPLLAPISRPLPPTLLDPDLHVEGEDGPSAEEQTEAVQEAYDGAETEADYTSVGQGEEPEA